jgi:hypothetical protein
MSMHAPEVKRTIKRVFLHTVAVLPEQSGRHAQSLQQDWIVGKSEFQSTMKPSASGPP